MGGINNIPLEHYKLCNRYLLHSDTIKWTVFSIFAAINGILIGALIQSDILDIGWGKIVLTVFGLGSSFVWLLIDNRTAVYLVDRINKAKKVERDYKFIFQDYTFWYDVKTGKSKRPKGISAGFVSMILILVIIGWWFLYLWICIVSISKCEIDILWALLIIIILLGYLNLILTVWFIYWNKATLKSKQKNTSQLSKRHYSQKL